MKFTVVEKIPASGYRKPYSDMSEGELRSLVVFQPSLISDCLTKEITDNNGDVIRCICSDIDMLLQMQQGKKFDEAIASELLARMSKQSDSLQSFYDQANDDELLQCIKSRYIQSPSELESYMEYLDSLRGDVSDEAIEKTVEETASVGDDSVEPVAETPSSSD